jgi:hypothetical protein
MIGAWISHQVHLTVTEIQTATAPIADLSDSNPTVDERYQLTLQILPDSGSWHRVISLWGKAPAALIATSGDERRVLNLNAVVLEVEVTNQGRSMPTRRTIYAPYGYSAATDAQGLEFDVQPGAELEIRIRQNPSRPRDSKLQTFFVWRDVAIKDALDSAVMDDQLASIGRLTSISGAIVLLVALGIWWVRRNRVKN